MLYSKQEWMKTTAEMNAIFGDVPEALDNTVEICGKVESYTIDHAPSCPLSPYPRSSAPRRSIAAKYTEKDLFDEFTQDENGNVVMSQADAEKKIEKLGGYDKLYRIKLEADYLRKLAFDGAEKRYGKDMPEETRTRLIFELHIMKTMGFPGYFLIVQDFIRAAREELDVSVGPGRGSAAGSAVAYYRGHHADRPHCIRSAVRAIPEPRPYLAARYRYRLRRRRPRPRAQLGNAEIRQGRKWRISLPTAPWPPRWP